MNQVSNEPIQFARVNAVTGSSQSIVALATGRIIRVVEMHIMADTDGTLVTWQSNATALAGPMKYNSGGGLVAKLESGILQTVSGEGFKATVTVGTINGWIHYQLLS